jgi:hypothetical protein
MGAGSNDGNDLARVIGRVTDAQHVIPGNKWPKLAGRYLHADGHAAFAGHAAMEVLFNYDSQYNSQRDNDNNDNDDADAILVEMLWAGKPFDEVRTGALWALHEIPVPGMG